VPTVPFSVITPVGSGNPPTPPDLPAGTQWRISSFTVLNAHDGVGYVGIFLIGGGGPIVQGPFIPIRPYETKQLLFPEPFVMTATTTGQSLGEMHAVWTAPEDQPAIIVVGSYVTP
jgi:hypothetical protein